MGGAINPHASGVVSCKGKEATHNVVENDVPNSTNATLGSSWWPSWSPRRRYGGGGSWHIHRGWHVSSYCQSLHVGRFCSSHRIIHCCNDYGHYVECNSAYTHSSCCQCLGAMLDAVVFK